MEPSFFIEIKEINFFDRIKTRLLIFLLVFGISNLFIVISSNSIASILSFFGFSLLPFLTIIIIPKRQYIHKVEIDESGFTLYGSNFDKKFIVHSKFENYKVYLEDITRKDRVLRYRIVFNINNKTYSLERPKGWTYKNMFIIMGEIQKWKEKTPFLIDGIFEMKNLKELSEHENTTEFTNTYPFLDI